MSQPLTGIIVAMQEELEVVLQSLQQPQAHQRAGMTFYQGIYAGSPVVAVICGVGKVNAALCTQILISEFHTQRIINIGVAGGLHPEIQPGDVVIADTLMQHDMDLRPLGLARGHFYRMDTHAFPSDPMLLQWARQACADLKNHRFFVGRIVTGDQFIASPELAQELHQHFDALACEMESASIAQVCFLNHIPFICIRSISDNANTGAHIDFAQFTPIAAANATTLLQSMIPLCQINADTIEFKA